MTGPSRRPGRHVHLPVAAAATPSISDDERRSIAEMRAKRTYANLATADLEGQLQAGDVEVVQEPTDQAYGLRDCAAKAPELMTLGLIRRTEVLRSG